MSEGASPGPRDVGLEPEKAEKRKHQLVQYAQVWSCAFSLHISAVQIYSKLSSDEVESVEYSEIHTIQHSTTHLVCANACLSLLTGYVLNMHITPSDVAGVDPKIIRLSSTHILGNLPMNSSVHSSLLGLSLVVSKCPHTHFLPPIPPLPMLWLVMVSGQ